MSNNVIIEWSGPFHNGILEIERSDSDILKLDQGIYMYVYKNILKCSKNSFPTPLYLGCLIRNIFIPTLQAKLIWNIAKYEMQEMFINNPNSLTVVIGNVITKDNDYISDHTMKSVYNSLLKQVHPTFFETNGFNGLRKSYKIQHCFKITQMAY